MTEEKTLRGKHILSNLFFALCIVCLLSVGVTFFANGKDFSRVNVFGYKCTYVLSGSMEPNIMTHALCFMKVYNSWEDTDIEEGDVIVYEKEIDGVTINIVHRVIEVTDEGYITKGDNNENADSPVVTDEQVIGEVTAVWNWTANIFG